MASAQAQVRQKLAAAEQHILAAMDRHPVISLRDQLQDLEKRTKWSRAWMALGIMQMVLLTVWLIGGLPLISKLVGFIYPAFSSFKAIDSPNQKNSEMWLTYWIVIAFLGLIEPVAWPLLNLIPLYQFVKMAFLMWCYNPSTRGASVIYAQVIRPLVLPALGISSSASSSSSGTAAMRSRPAGTSKGATLVETDEHEQDETSAGDAPEGPQVIARIISASGLPAMESDRTDAYVLLSVQDEADGSLLSAKSKTKTKPSALDPKWNEELHLTLKEKSEGSVPSGAKLVAQVYHKTGFGHDLSIGRVSVGLSNLAGGQEVSGVYELEDPDKENKVGVSGSLRLALRLIQ